MIARPDSAEALRKMFTLFDADGNGALSQQEWENFASHLYVAIVRNPNAEIVQEVSTKFAREAPALHKIVKQVSKSPHPVFPCRA